MDNWSGNSSSMFGRIFKRGAQFFGSFISSYKVITSLEDFCYKQIRKSSRFRSAKVLIENMNPDIVFCTHQRVFSVSPEIEAAKSLGIKTATAIFSWDNLPKGRLPFRSDQYFVWSDYMKEEMAYYYPEINANSVVVTGTPQFDFYFTKNMILPRDQFASRFNLDPKTSWVCFSGSDSLSSPNDPKYLADVANALNFEDEIQLIFRPVPVESIDRFFYVLNTYSKIILAKPKWNRGNQWGNFFPFYEDLIDLVNLAYHCKVVLNLGSTMALDFSVYGNLAFFLKYEHEQKPENWSVNTIYRYQHFQSMEGLKAVGFIFSPEEILEKVKDGILRPDYFAPDRMKWFQKVVQPDPKKLSSQRVVDALTSLISSPNY
jgi:hypothetical protein